MRLGLNVFVFSLLHICMLLNLNDLKAQDIQLTQYFASGTFLNPAFTGVNGCLKISSVNRKQWNSFSGGYSTNIFTIEMPLTLKHNAVGLSFLSDVAGSGRLFTKSIKGLYSYSVYLTRKKSFVFGLEGAYTFHGADYSSYLFADQIIRGGDVSSVEINNLSNTSYMDFSSGVLYYSEKYWVGVSFHHLNTPNQSLTGQEGKLPIKYSFHGGFKMKIDNQLKEVSLLPSFNYKAQEKFDQLDIGTYYEFKNKVIGIWYRGIPVLKSYEIGEPNNDAIGIIIGFELNKFKIGYSYDITISKLSITSSGSHELTASFTTCSKKRKRRRNLVPCAKF